MQGEYQCIVLADKGTITAGSFQQSIRISSNHEPLKLEGEGYNPHLPLPKRPQRKTSSATIKRKSTL